MEERLHNLTLEGRSKLNISGVDEVVSFNEREVLLNINSVLLTVKGEGIKVDSVSKETGEVEISGEVITSMMYSRGVKRNESLLGRVFK